MLQLCCFKCTLIYTSQMLFLILRNSVTTARDGRVVDDGRPAWDEKSADDWSHTIIARAVAGREDGES